MASSWRAFSACSAPSVNIISEANTAPSAWLTVCTERATTSGAGLAAGLGLDLIWAAAAANEAVNRSFSLCVTLLDRGTNTVH